MRLFLHAPQDRRNVRFRPIADIPKLIHIPRMFDRLSVRRLALLLGSITVVVVAFAYISLAGSAVVVDETDGVERALIVTSDGREQPLYRLWNGYFYAIPQLEGTIEVRCHDGSRKSWGYVSGYMDTKIRAVGDKPCARLVEEV